MHLVTTLFVLTPAIVFLYPLPLALASNQAPIVPSRTKHLAMTDLAEWTRSHLEPLFASHEDASFESAYNAAFTPDASIRTANAGEKHGTEANVDEEKLVAGKGERVEEASGNDARAILEKHMKGAVTTAHTRVEWQDVNARDGPDGKTVEGSCTIVRSLKFRIRAAPATMHTEVTFSAVIPDPSSPKISHYTQTIATHRPPIVMPHLAVQPNRGAEL